MRYPGTRPLVRRMQAIDQALRARKWPTDKTLAKDLQVDPRTIRHDLEFMRDERQAPIAFDRARRGYHYTEPTYRLPPLQMSQGELLALYLSERLMKQFRDTPFEPDRPRAIAKLGEMLPVSAAHTLGPEPSASANWSHWKHIAVMLISLEE